MANEEKFLKPVHPGEVLLYDFMQPLNISQNALARAIGVSPPVSMKSYMANAQ